MRVVSRVRFVPGATDEPVSHRLQPQGVPPWLRLAPGHEWRPRSRREVSRPLPIRDVARRVDGRHEGVPGGRRAARAALADGGEGGGEVNAIEAVADELETSTESLNATFVEV